MLNREYDAIISDAKATAAQQGQSYEKLVEAEGKENVEKRFNNSRNNR